MDEPRTFLDMVAARLAAPVADALYDRLAPLLDRSDEEIMATLANLQEAAQTISDQAQANADEVSEAIDKINELLAAEQVDSPEVQAVLDQLNASAGRINETTTRLADATEPTNVDDTPVEEPIVPPEMTEPTEGEPTIG